MAKRPSKTRQRNHAQHIIAAIRRALFEWAAMPAPTEETAIQFAATIARELGSSAYGVRISAHEISVWGGPEEDGTAVYLQWHPRSGKTWQESVDATLKRYEAVLSHREKR